MNKPTKTIFDFFKKDQKVNFSEVQTVDGITLYYEGELAIGTPVFVLDAENNEIPAPEGDFQVDIEGSVFVLSVDVNGVVSAMEQVMKNDPAPAPAPNEEFVSKTEFDTIVQKIIEDADSRIASIEAKFEAFVNLKDSKFKDQKTKTGTFTAVTVRDILTKK